MGLTKAQRLTVRSNETILRLGYGDIRKTKGCYQYLVKHKGKYGVIEIYPEVKVIIPIEFEKVIPVFDYYIGEETCEVAFDYLGMLQECPFSTVFNRTGEVINKKSIDERLYNKNSTFHTLPYVAKRYKITSKSKYNKATKEAEKLVETNAVDLSKTEMYDKIAKIVYDKLDSPEMVDEEITVVLFKKLAPLKIKKHTALYELNINGRYVIALGVAGLKNIKNPSVYIPKEYRSEEEKNLMGTGEYPRMYVREKNIAKNSIVYMTPRIFNGFLDEGGKYHDNAFYVYSKATRPTNIDEPWQCLTDTGETIMTNSIGLPIDDKFMAVHNSVVVCTKSIDGKVVIDMNGCFGQIDSQ